jgi:hypothetical protein
MNHPADQKVPTIANNVRAGGGVGELLQRARHARAIADSSNRESAASPESTDYSSTPK